ncbi:putative plastidic glucose transporter 1 [Bienertia sinuspersici]
MEAIATVTAFYRPFSSLPMMKLTTINHTKLKFVSLNNSMRFRHFKPHKQFSVTASDKKKNSDFISNQKSDNKAEELLKGKDGSAREIDLGWLPALPHVSTASMANFLFGYHIGVMNGPIVSVARELGFEGNSIIEGLVVSIFIAGAFIGSLVSGTLVDKLGCRRTFQIDTIPLIIGAILSAQAHSVDEVLWGRFLVGLGIGVNTVLVPIYISEMGRLDDAKSIIRNLWGPSEVDSAIEEFQSVFNGNEGDINTNWLELFKEPNYKGLQLPGGSIFSSISKDLWCRSNYFGFGGVSLLSAIFCYSFIIETKGRSLEEIEMSYGSELPGRDN